MFKRNKYGAQRTNGFPSKLESAVYDILLQREKLGEISEIERQQIMVLFDGPKESRITWRVDFSFTEATTGKKCFAEAKGLETEAYRLKLKIWRNLKPAPLEIWMGHYKRPQLKERIE